MLTGSEMQLGRGETVGDTARVLSRYIDAIMIRILDHDLMLELAEYAEVPVINALTKVSHPCQIMADVLTFEEHRGPIQGRTIAWSGDANNVLASWVHARRGSTSPSTSPPPSNSRRHPPCSPGRSRRAHASTSPPTPSRRWTVPMPSSPIAGSRWATTTSITATPALALPGECQADGGGQGRRDLHALPPRPSRRGSDGRDHGRSPPRWCSTKPRTACMRRRASWRGAWGREARFGRGALSRGRRSRSSIPGCEGADLASAQGGKPCETAGSSLYPKSLPARPHPGVPLSGLEGGFPCSLREPEASFEAFALLRRLGMSAGSRIEPFRSVANRMDKRHGEAMTSGHEISPTVIEGADDVALPFSVEALDVRGRVVRLGPASTPSCAAMAIPTLWRGCWVRQRRSPCFWARP